MRQLRRWKRTAGLPVRTWHRVTGGWIICNTVAPEAPCEINNLAQRNTCHTSMTKVVREKDKELLNRNCTVATVAPSFAPSRARATERL